MKPKIKPVINSCDRLNGAIATTKKFYNKIGKTIFGYSAARNEEFISILLGSKKKDEEVTDEECNARLLMLGYISVDDIDEVLGKEKTDKLLDKVYSKYKKMFVGVEE